MGWVLTTRAEIEITISKGSEISRGGRGAGGGNDKCKGRLKQGREAVQGYHCFKVATKNNSNKGLED